MAKRSYPEDALHKQVAHYLRLVLTPATVWFHPANGGARSAAEGAKFKAQGVTPGVADIILVHNGWHYEIELKAGKGRQSANQASWQAALERAGGQYVVSKSVDDVRMALRKFGIPTRERHNESESARDNCRGIG